MTDDEGCFVGLKEKNPICNSSGIIQNGSLFPVSRYLPPFDDFEMEIFGRAAWLSASAWLLGLAGWDGPYGPWV